MDSIPLILFLLHQVDEPVLVAGAEDRVPASETLPTHRDDHHVVVELLGVVGAAVPDALRHGAWHAIDRGLVLEVQVPMSCSTTRKARRFFFVSVGIPLGTAQETRTPSLSSRKSKWWLLA
jgi:hypothetical protein